MSRRSSRRGAVFQSVGALHPGRSVFNLSHEKKFDTDFGKLIPIMCKEVVPGDTFKISNAIVIRFQPIVHPIMHEITVATHYFFCPTRILRKFLRDPVTGEETDEYEEFDWTEFITGGEDGNYDKPQPRIPDSDLTKYSLCDYLGLPIGYTTSRDDLRPTVWGKRVYNLCYNEYYRDENLIDPVDLDSNTIQNRAWTKDYFTSAILNPQRGTSPSFPISGAGHLVLPDGTQLYNTAWPISWLSIAQWSAGLNPNSTNGSSQVPQPNNQDVGTLTPIYGSTATPLNAWPSITTITRAFANNPPNNAWAAGSAVIPPVATTGYGGGKLFSWMPSALNDYFNSIGVDISDSTLLADINDIRTAFQIQKWLERNARSGVRYTEFLQAHFGVSPRDERLQRPEYIGGSVSPIIISEVLQTSSTDTTSPQGNLAGHGITADRTRIGTYHAQEYGYIMGIMSVMPRPAYQQGIERQWLRNTNLDYYFREFANLSERSILGVEICAVPNNDTYNASPFGFQGMYDELRVAHDQVCGGMRDDFITWHLGRVFDPANPPALNKSFIECDSTTGGANNPLKRIFAVKTTPGLICNVANIITAIRPMPSIPEPGMIDHY